MANDLLPIVGRRRFDVGYLPLEINTSARDGNAGTLSNNKIYENKSGQFMDMISLLKELFFIDLKRILFFSFWRSLCNIGYMQHRREVSDDFSF